MDVTSQIDDFLHGFQSSQITMSIWVMWFAVVVVLIVIGLDFWRNIFGMIFFPRMNFSRIAGELQMFPGLFVALLFGLINGIIGFNYYRIDEVKGSFLAQMNDTISPLLQQLSDMTGMQLNAIIETMTKDPDYAYGLLAVIPLICGFSWFFYALALFINSKFVSKAGGSLGNYLAGISYFSWITPLLFLGYWIGFINPTTGWILKGLAIALFIFYFTFTIRDFMHIPWGNTLVSVIIITPVIFIILMALFVVLCLVAVNQLGQYM